jgi:nitrogen regulatory protein P-II 1
MGYIARYKLEIILADEKIAEVVSAIKENARTGEIGDGKIYVSDLEGVYRIRTGEEGNAAI